MATTDWRQVLGEADIDTARLILQLQMQDAATLATQPGKQPFQQSDADIARQIFEDDIRQLQGLLPDREISETLTDNINDNERSLEKAAFCWSFDEWQNKVDRVAGVTQDPAAPPVQPPPVKLSACTACADKFNQNEMVRAPCKHLYCRDCLEYLFKSSMKDESLYPPRCCKKPIPINDARKLLSKDVATEFTNRKEEFETKDKTYCYRPQCSAFIRPYTMNGNHAKCPRCKESTCTDCKNRYHYGDCPRDEAKEQLLATANENHWKQCSECHRFIELKHGCYHITCRCKHQFCYLCGEVWKTCRCTRWDEAALLERGQRYARNFMPGAQAQAQNQAQQQNIAGPAPIPAYAQPVAAGPAIAPQFQNMQYPVAYQYPMQPQVTQQAVQQAVEHIRNNHECDHNSFTTYRESGEELVCEICGETYYTWINQCRQCLMLICVRCKHNRL